MDEKELVKRAYSSVESAWEHAADLRDTLSTTGKLDVKMTRDLLVSLRDATAAAQELENRGRGIQPDKSGN